MCICVVAGGAGDVSVLMYVYLCSCWRCWRCQCTNLYICVVAGGAGDAGFLHGEQELQGPDIPAAV